MSNRQLIRLFKCLLVLTCGLFMWHILGFGNWTYNYFQSPRSISQRYPDAKPFSYKSRKRINSHNTELNETELAALVERSKILPKGSKNIHKNDSDPQPTLPSWMFYQMAFQGDKWVSNKTNAEKFRTELRGIELNSRTHMVLSHKTTPVGVRLPCYFCKPNDTVQVQSWFTRVMPQSSPLEGKSFKRCSVVGNGGILANSTCGANIDKADYIFRCNLPPIAKYIRDAGQKTNLVSLNPSMIMSRTYIGDMSRRPILGEGVSTCSATVESNTSTLMIGHPGHFRKVWDFWRARGLKQVLSTGFYLATTALELCDEVHLYGFWPFPFTFYSEEPIRYHYFDKVKAKSETHSMALEFWELWQMHQDGILRLHITPCYGGTNSPKLAEHQVSFD
ncbi:alpha-2,8-sialyltransferase 8E-like [Amphiura filiformis]|uniref:alpha-2,8-sialyltransferase 8E-like n=1 Tax=Amphiura filiformis TaxID=82378 RepID=UPI003B21B6A7